MIKKILATVVLFTVLISSNATASRFENVKIGSILPHIGGVIFFNIKDVSLDNVQGAGSCATASAGYYSCLLYTSPSPRDKRQSRMPSSA